MASLFILDSLGRGYKRSPRKREASPPGALGTPIRRPGIERDVVSCVNEIAGQRPRGSRFH